MSDAQHQQPIEEETSGATPRLSKAGWAWVIAGLAALTAVTAWFALGQADQDARWKTVGYDIQSPTEAEITFDVHVYADEPVECVVRAMTTSFAEVGIASHTVDPDDGRTQRITLPITTVEEATTAEVNYCAIVE
ncbi:DUF4307 domain-containing protein [Demequina flava]|uniref:DUF4307 domain-containing protein n=1 Tax=Demequina flava TaxID=1095025 RepID=UPI00078155AF|nr:DUF4307 domain-containing protein [Demequina flava]